MSCRRCNQEAEWGRALLRDGTILFGEPVPWARPRFKGRRGFTAPAVAAAKERMAWELRAARVGGLAKRGWNVSMDIRFFFAGRRAGDLDNYVKLVLDAANGVLYEDDRQVVKLRAEIFTGDDRTEIGAWAILAGKERTP